MKCFECFQKAKESNESDQSFSPGFYGIKLKLESLVEILLQDTQIGRSIRRKKIRVLSPNKRNKDYQ